MAVRPWFGFRLRRCAWLGCRFNPMFIVALVGLLIVAGWIAEAAHSMGF
jgi:hypothetical protein